MLLQILWPGSASLSVGLTRIDLDIKQIVVAVQGVVQTVLLVLGGMIFASNPVCFALERLSVETRGPLFFAVIDERWRNYGLNSIGECDIIYG